MIRMVAAYQRLLRKGRVRHAILKDESVVPVELGAMGAALHGVAIRDTPRPPTEPPTEGTMHDSSERTYQSPSDGGIRELLSMAAPLVVSQGCETLMMFTDRLLMSRVGPAYMAATMSGGLTSFMLTTFFVGLIGYTNALVAQYYGARRPRNCGLVTGQALIIAVIAYPVLLGTIPIGIGLFRVMHVPSEQLVPQIQYFTVVTFGSILALFRGALSSFFSGIGRTRIVMLSAATSLVVNVVVAYVLIFGRLGLPPLGIVGAGFGMIFGSTCGICVMIVFYLKVNHRRDYGTVSGLRWHGPTMSKLLRLGSPAGTELFLNLTAFNLLVMLFHSRGPAVAAAVTVAFNWDMVSFVPLIGVNVGVASLVGRYMGAGQPDSAHRITMSAVRLVTCYAFGIILTYSLEPRWLVQLFLEPSNHEAWQLGIYMVRLVSVYVFADALQLVFGGALRGAGDTFATMCLSVAGHWILLLGTFVMLRVLETPTRVAWGVLVGLIWILGAVFYLRYRTGHWRTLRVVEPELEPAEDANAAPA